MNFFTHLECGYCGKIYDKDRIWNLCTDPECSKPLLARYDLDRAKKELNRSQLVGREQTMWRYREMLPVSEESKIITLGEGGTPLQRAEGLEKKLNHQQVYIKDEGINPTGSFKARGLGMAISRANELGIQAVSIPTAGNAGGAMSAYAALAGMEAAVFMPKDVPEPFITECRVLGATVTLVDGVITDCGKAAAAELKDKNRFDVSTLKEPYRIEGKKTMGYELAEQLNWTLPDVIIYPTGGGTGLIGMWKAFDEMEALGWIGPERPRMISVQAEGCAPMVRAYNENSEFAEFWEDAATVADGMRVPAAVGDFLILRAIRESRGSAIAVSDEEIIHYSKVMAGSQGIFPAPEGGATLAALVKLQQLKKIDAGEQVVLFNTGSGHKYYRAWMNLKP